MDLVTFLRARLDEREAAARAAGGDSWVAESRTYGSYAVACDGEPVVYDEGAPTEEQAAHIALNDPAFVLDDVAAKRRIVDTAFRHLAVIDGEWGCCHSAEAIAAGKCPENSPDQSEIIRLLAAPFAQHPDFDPAWAVEGTVTT